MDWRMGAFSRRRHAHRLASAGEGQTSPEEETITGLHCPKWVAAGLCEGGWAGRGDIITLQSPCRTMCHVVFSPTSCNVSESIQGRHYELISKIRTFKWLDKMSPVLSDGTMPFESTVLFLSATRWLKHDSGSGGGAKPINRSFWPLCCLRLCFIVAFL